jgi:tetratricopeptide (TPR) repeat protein
MRNPLPWMLRTGKEKMVVLTGAGVSVSSGLPGGPELCARVVKSLCDNLYEENIRLESLVRGIPLESVFQVLTDNGFGDIIDKLISRFDSNALSATHRAIAALAEQGEVAAIITFNFDTLHEKSLTDWKTSVPRQYGRVVLKFFEKAHSRIELIKVHGSSETSGTLRFSEYIHGFTNQAKIKISTLLDNAYLLVLGYGGWDYDFWQLIQDFIASGQKPREVIWIDKSFPQAGGRTDLVKLLRETGCKVTVLTEDIEERFSQFRKADEGSICSINMEDICSAITAVCRNNRLNTVAELALLSPDLGFLKDMVYLLQEDEKEIKSLVLGSIYERLGDIAKAKQHLRIAAEQAKNINERFIASIKLFRLTRMNINLVSSIPAHLFPHQLRPYYELVDYGLRTDKGGLDRSFAKQLCEDLPPVEEVRRAVKDGYSIQMMIYFHSEVARLAYEVDLYQMALENDKAALALAQIMSNPELLMLAQGNVGVSLMGLAELESEDNSLWKQARDYLERATMIPPSFNVVRHSLFSANLGLVYYYLGDLKKAISICEDSIKILAAIYPNYSIYFYGEVPRIYLDLYRLESNPRDLARAVDLLRAGLALSIRLQDFDDIWAIRKGFDYMKASSNEQVVRELPEIEKELVIVEEFASASHSTQHNDVGFPEK